MREARPEAFLFDLDGTLIDTELLWTRSIVDFLASRGAGATVEELLPNVIGRNSLDINRYLHETYPQIGETTSSQDAEELRVFFKRHAAGSADIVIKPAVGFFRKAAAIATCAIVSGSPHDDILSGARLCGISEMTALVLGAGEYAFGKPDPSGYLKAAEILKVDPAKCVVIEDSTVGVASGVNAGMNVIAVARATPGPAQDFTGARWVVGSLSELDPEEILI